MTSDEAEAAVELDKQFWAELQSNEIEFLWLPKVNYLTGKRMWLCKAVRAFSGHTVELNVTVPKASFHFYTTRWYKPKDFTFQRLKN